jgi:hypothetical protein
MIKLTNFMTFRHENFGRAARNGSGYAGLISGYEWF